MEIGSDLRRSPVGCEQELIDLQHPPGTHLAEILFGSAPLLVTTPPGFLPLEIARVCTVTSQMEK